MGKENHFDVVVVGGGIIGLAVGRALARRGRGVLVLERHHYPVSETSSRNSGVIHSGIYYVPGSLKARLCLSGRQMLYAFADEKGVPYHRCGKLIVAQAGQQAALEALFQKARDNGVTDLVPLGPAAVRAYEPAIGCVAGLWSPSTGIIDVHELAHALIADLESAGGSVVYRTSLDSARLDEGQSLLVCRSGEDSVELTCNAWVNAAGLDAVPLLHRIEGYPAHLLRTAWYAKGNYFALMGMKPFRHLVYPMPDEAGLGIHATLDLQGAIRFGPDVEWVDRPDYVVDPGRAAGFRDSIRCYWPGLPDSSLRPDYAGVRPKLVGPGSTAADFVIEGPADHGRGGLVNLLGIESPGLTSCLAIGEYVAGLL